ncbi:unnamed protein product, partial [Ostreobium quekettii]
MVPDVQGSSRAPSISEDTLVDALIACCREDIEKIALAEATDQHCPLQLDVLCLANENPLVAEALVKSPNTMLQRLDDAAIKAQERILKSHRESEQRQAKDTVHIRVHSLPYALDPSCESLNPGVGHILCHHVGRLLSFTGTVVRTGVVKIFESQRLYECSKCRHRFVVDAQIELGGFVELPLVCPSQRDRPCGCSTFKHLEEVQVLTNYQEVRVQEKMHCLAMGTLPRSTIVVLRDDLADICCTGDDVEVTAVITQRWRHERPGERCDVEIIALANNVRLLNAHKSGLILEPSMDHKFREFWKAHEGRPLAGRNMILASICPQIHGLFMAKLALVLMLIGGLQHTDDSGMNTRGTVHMLLIGDPGTGKSQLMKYAARLSPRSVITSGKGASGAGLTATAVKDGGSWCLEAGAMVLADGGLCCIDEFNGIKDADRGMIHEAMEQQTVSIAK